MYTNFVHTYTLCAFMFVCICVSMSISLCLYATVCLLSLHRLYVCVCLYLCALYTYRQTNENVCKWWYKLRLFSFRFTPFNWIFPAKTKPILVAWDQKNNSNLFFKANYIDRIWWSFWLNLRKSRLSPFDRQLFKNKITWQERAREQDRKKPLIDIIS